ncbi:MAG TPA: hypothetical protein VJ844_08870 [Mucilaginibacter sp.]|nr:hypothetical protein [Mucilaginibacter sp.]
MKGKDYWVFNMNLFKKINYPRLALINFLVLTIFGIVLRYIQLYSVPFLNYQYILHAHSHFAFSGWMFFALALLISYQLWGKQLPSSVGFTFLFALISAYGMLISFLLQGYKPISITFSTIFILVTYCFTYVVFKGALLRNKVNSTAYKFIWGALIFLCISSLGPFFLGPLSASGYKNSPLYQDAIYFYLHFQMNGFMVLASLGLIATTLLKGGLSKNKRIWLDMFIYSTMPLYFIFTLWDKPDEPVRILAYLGAGLNLVSWFMLCLNFKAEWRRFSFLVKAALIAVTLKVIFQFLTCFPAIGDWVFLSRNLIIGYIHLLTLGIVMPVILVQLIKQGFFKNGKALKIINRCYLVITIVYLSLLFIQPLVSLMPVTIPKYQLLLFILCFSFLPVGSVFFVATKKDNS